MVAKVGIFLQSELCNFIASPTGRFCIGAGLFTHVQPPLVMLKANGIHIASKNHLFQGKQLSRQGQNKGRKFCKPNQ